MVQKDDDEKFFYLLNKDIFKDEENKFIDWLIPLQESKRSSLETW
jgi:hypothetical protein